MSSASIPPLLSSVCLCAIVKNERVNPAGGIVAYLDRILPAVHTAVIVDTGSDDGTLEALRARESTEQRHRSHLHVFETPFVSFADARNDALRKALEVRDQQQREGRSTFKHILVLDADEVLSPACIEVLASVLALDRSDPSAAGCDGVAPLLEKSSSSSLTDKSSRSSAVHSASPSSNAMSPPRCRSRAPSSAAECAASAAASAATAAESSMLAEAFAGFMLPAAALAPPAPAVPATPLLPYPLALKCSCHCYAANGLASPRSNSGLWNPRLFSADARFSFVNLVDNYRFERLLFAGREIASECYLRESDLPEHIRITYEALRAQELRAASGESSASSGAATGGDSPSSATSNKDFDFGSPNANGSSHGGQYFDELTTPASAPTASSASGGTSTASVSPCPPNTGAEEDASWDLRVSSPAIGRSQPLLIPMRHFIPSLAGRRQKNQAYKEGGARAKAAAAAALVAAGGTASADSPCSLSSRSMSGSYSPLPPGSRSPQPKTTPSSRSRIYQPTNY